MANKERYYGMGLLGSWKEYMLYLRLLFKSVVNNVSNVCWERWAKALGIGCGTCYPATWVLGSSGIPGCYNIPGTEGGCSLPTKLSYGVCASCYLKPGSQVGSYLELVARIDHFTPSGLKPVCQQRNCNTDRRLMADLRFLKLLGFKEPCLSSRT